VRTSAWVKRTGGKAGGEERIGGKEEENLVCRARDTSAKLHKGKAKGISKSKMSLNVCNDDPSIHLPGRRIVVVIKRKSKGRSEY